MSMSDEVAGVRGVVGMPDEVDGAGGVVSVPEEELVAEAFLAMLTALCKSGSSMSHRTRACSGGFCVLGSHELASICSYPPLQASTTSLGESPNSRQILLATGLTRREPRILQSFATRWP